MKKFILLLILFLLFPVLFLCGCSSKNEVGENNRNFDGDFRAMAVVERDGLREEAHRYALLIGVNEYNKPISSLKFCMNDMKYLAETFEAIGFQRENITLMTDESASDLRPTKNNILNQVEMLCEMMSPEDLLIIAFSGHGVMVDGKAYLCPGDANAENADSLVSRDWVYEQLETSQAAQKLMIMDACRNEITIAGSRSFGNARTLEDPTGAQGKGFVLLASCRPKQVSWEMPELKHGVFTHFLAEGLRGGAKNDEGYVSILALADYASQKTKTYVHRNLNTLQVPMVQMPDEMTNFLLAKLEAEPTETSASPVVSGPVPPPAPPVVSGPVTPPAPPKPEVRTAGDRMVKTVDGIEYAFRWCPAGTFTMGSPDWLDDETQHRVTLTRGFWMLETEVTQGMWESVMGTSIQTQASKGTIDTSLEGTGSEYPIYYVNWEESRTFCEKLSSKLGVQVSLPTEAQWEYACRADSTGEYAGDLDAMAWYESNSGYKTHPVGQKKANAWGLDDMHGNVWEWCSDWYGKDYYAESPTSDPTGPNSGSYRVNRGGGWSLSAEYCRSAYRLYYGPDLRSNSLGFRIVLADPAPGK